MILYIVLIALTISYTYYRLKNKRKFRLAKQFDGPVEVPVFGNTLFFSNRSPHGIYKQLRKVQERNKFLFCFVHAEIIPFFQEATEKYGSIYRIWIGTRFAFVVTDPKVCEIVFTNATKFLEKSALYDFLLPWLGTGLLLSSGKKWQSRR